MLDQVARHGMVDLAVKAEGDLHIDAHHTVEDVGIVIGQAVAKALGEEMVPLRVYSWRPTANEELAVVVGCRRAGAAKGCSVVVGRPGHAEDAISTP